MHRHPDRFTDWELAIVATDRLPMECYDQLLQGSEDVCRNLARNRKVPVEILWRLAEDKSELVRGDLAARSDAPPEILVMLAREGHSVTKVAVSRNWSAPSEALEALVDECDMDAMYGVPSHPNVTPDLLDRIVDVCAAEQHISVSRPIVRSVARSHTASNATLSYIAELCTHDQSVKMALASNPHTPECALRLAASDASENVRAEILTHPNTPSDVVDALSYKNPHFRKLAAAHPNTSPRRLLRFSTKRYEGEVWEALSGNPSAPQEALRRLAKSGNRYVRLRVAANPSTPADMLMSLSSGDQTIRNVVARNSSTPPEALTMLMMDENRNVRNNASHTMSERQS